MAMNKLLSTSQETVRVCAPSTPPRASAAAGTARQKGRVVMIGTFPPPVYGASKNNQLIFDALQQAGTEVIKLNTAASSMGLDRRFGFHAQRIARNTSALVRARRFGTPDSVLYIVPNAGAGIWYTLAQVAWAAGHHSRLVLHHRTYSYIDERSREMARITKMRPARTTHIFLSAGMAEAFQRVYGPVDHLIASNARFVAAEAEADPSPRPEGPLRIGHLSNLCEEKGFFDVAEAFEAVVTDGAEAELWLAGPVVDARVRTRLANLIAGHPGRVRHLGPLHGTAKRDFYRLLDVFLFPTRYRKEAAPNVVFEALAAGTPVLATRRASIAEIVGPECGGVCDPAASFAGFTLDYVRDLALDPQASRVRASAIKGFMRRECRRSLDEYGALMALLGAGAAARLGQEF